MLFSILAMLYLGAAIMVAFIKTPVTTVPRFKLSLYTFLEKTVMPLALLRFFNSTCRGVFMAYNILYAIQMGVLNSGMVISTFAMANLLARPVSGYLTDRISRHKPFVIGIYLFLLAGFILFAFNVFAGAAVIGLGMGMESSAINGIAMKKSEHSALNRTSATMEVSFSLGMIAGASLSALYTGPLASLFIITAFVYLCPIAIIFYKRT